MFRQIKYRYNKVPHIKFHRAKFSNFNFRDPLLLESRLSPEEQMIR